MDDKWLMFKNYMHNELGITKDDIRVWIKEAAHEEARKLVDQTFKRFDIKDFCNQYIKENLLESTAFWGLSKESDFKRKIANEIVSQLEITIKQKDKE